MEESTLDGLEKLDGRKAPGHQEVKKRQRSSLASKVWRANEPQDSSTKEGDGLRKKKKQKKKGGERRSHIKRTRRSEIGMDK
jgi:hypothetical protein